MSKTNKTTATIKHVERITKRQTIKQQLQQHPHQTHSKKGDTHKDKQNKNTQNGRTKNKIQHIRPIMANREK